MTASPVIPVLDKAVRVLYAVAGGRPFASMNAMARELGLAPSTCHRILKTFEAVDWLRPVERGYELSHGLLPLAEAAAPLRRLGDALGPALEDLTSATGLSAKASVRAGDRAVTIARREPDLDAAVTARLGNRFPLTIGSSGSALLADADSADLERLIRQAPDHIWRHRGPDDLRRRVREARRKGYCVDRGSYRPEVWTLSAPVYAGTDPRGRPGGTVVASITLMGFPDDFAPRRLPRHAAVLRRAAAEAGRRLCASAPDPSAPATRT